jgi:hypothetical protein
MLLCEEFHRMVIFYAPGGLTFPIQAKFLIFKVQLALAFGIEFLSVGEKSLGSDIANSILREGYAM